MERKENEVLEEGRERDGIGIRPGFVFGLCGALLIGMLLGSAVIPWMAAKLDAARLPSGGIMGNLVDIESLKDEDGKFVILDYPREAALKYVELGDIGELRIEPVEKPEITEQDVDDNVESWIIYYGFEEDRLDGVVEADDRVYLRYSSSHGGEPLDGYATEGAVIRLGIGEEPVGFTENIAGMSVGETKAFMSGFPEDWPDEDVRGMTDVEFEVQVLSVRELPELTDEKVMIMTDSACRNEAEFREYIRGELEAMDAETYRNTVYGEALDALAGIATFRSMPQELLDWYVSMQMYYYQLSADKSGMTVEAYMQGQGIGDNPGLVANAIADSGTEAIRRYALLTAAAEQAGVDFDLNDDEDLHARGSRLAELSGGLDVLPDEAGEIYRASNLENDVRNGKMIDWLVENIRQEHVEDPEGVTDGEGS